MIPSMFSRAWLGSINPKGVSRSPLINASIRRRCGLSSTPPSSNQYSVDFYVSFVLALSLAFGVAFQLPIVVVFLALSGLAPVARIAAARRYFILGIVIVAAVLTPPDVASQILLAIPMVILFEAGLVIARMATRGRQAGSQPVQP